MSDRFNDTGDVLVGLGIGILCGLAIFLAAMGFYFLLHPIIGS